MHSDMTPADYQQIRQKLNLNQSRLAALLGVNIRTIQRREEGSIPITWEAVWAIHHVAGYPREVPKPKISAPEPEISGPITLDAEKHQIPNGGARLKYPFNQMQVGDSFTFSALKMSSVYSLMRFYKHKGRFAVRQISATEARCWRVS